MPITSIIVAGAIIVVYSGLASADRGSWIVRLSILAGLLALSVAGGFVLGATRPRMAGGLIHAWTPLVVLIVATAVAAALIVVFDANADVNLGSDATASGAAGIVGGLATIAGLIVEGTRGVVAAHRTPWLAETRYRWLVGNTADARSGENEELWDRLWGANPAPDRWSYRGIVKTLQLVKEIRASRR